MSAFGTSQANREIWEGDTEAQRYQTRIRDLMLIIALDSLGLSEIITISDDYEPAATSLLRSRDRLIAVHLFLLEQSEDLSSTNSGDGGFPAWPMPVVCLAWAIVLNSLPANLLPPSPGYGGPMYYEFASRALRLQSGLFPWIEQVLVGPLLEPNGDMIGGEASEEVVTSQRLVIKGR